MVKSNKTRCTWQMLDIVQSMYVFVKSTVNLSNNINNLFECQLVVRQGECLPSITRLCIGLNLALFILRHKLDVDPKWVRLIIVCFTWLD